MFGLSRYKVGRTYSGLGYIGPAWRRCSTRCSRRRSICLTVSSLEFDNAYQQRYPSVFYSNFIAVETFLIILYTGTRLYIEPREMSYRPVYLLKYQATGQGRKHVAIFIPNAAHVDKNPTDRNSGCLGTIIHVIGAPMSGFAHQFKRNYNSSESRNLESGTNLGSVDSRHVHDPSTTQFSTDQQSSGANMLDDLALRVPAPPISPDWMNPANAVRNLFDLSILEQSVDIDKANIRDCQNWAQDYVARLATANLMNQAAAQTMTGLVDPPVAIQLRSPGSNVPAPARFNSQPSLGPSTAIQARPQQEQQQQSVWQWDAGRAQNRRWDATTQAWVYAPAGQTTSAQAQSQSGSQQLTWQLDLTTGRYRRWDATYQQWVDAPSAQPAPGQAQPSSAQPQAQSASGWQFDQTTRQWRRWDAAGAWVYS